MARFIFVRHGDVEGMHPLRFRGRRDVELSELGTRQAERTTQRIARTWRPAMIYTNRRPRKPPRIHEAVTAETEIERSDCPKSRT